MSEESTVTARPRLAALDGLRGIAIVLVVLSHGWVLWPTETVDGSAWLRPLFRNGNSAVTIFLVASGFLTYRSLHRHGSLEAMQPGVSLLRRVLRVGPTLWLMLVALLVVAATDSTDTMPKESNLDGVLHILTYTWNWYVQDNLLASRADLGHLWYLSVDMQAFVLVAGLIYVLRRRPWGLPLALSGLWLLLVWWRSYISEREDALYALVRTTVRMDAFVLGVLAASLLPFLGALASTGRALYVATLVALVPLFAWCDVDTTYLGLGGTLLQLDAALFLVALSLAPPERPRVPLLTNGLLVHLGRNSLSLYVWHRPVFYFVERHTQDWSWEARTLVGITATLLISVTIDRVVDARMARFLAAPGWRKLDGGLARWISASAREAWQASRAPGAPTRRRSSAAASPGRRGPAPRGRRRS